MTLKEDDVLHSIYFYRDKNGKSQVEDYLTELAGMTDKDSRVKLKKIAEYIKALRIYGTMVGQPYVKHIDGDIWELRPLKDRIFFVGWHNGSYVLLHTFVKKTRKTPKREIEQAKREYEDLKARGLEDEEE